MSFKVKGKLCIWYWSLFAKFEILRQEKVKIDKIIVIWGCYGWSTVWNGTIWNHLYLIAPILPQRMNPKETAENHNFHNPVNCLSHKICGSLGWVSWWPWWYWWSWWPRMAAVTICLTVVSSSLWSLLIYDFFSMIQWPGVHLFDRVTFRVSSSYKVLAWLIFPKLILSNIYLIPTSLLYNYLLGSCPRLPESQ